MEEVLVSFEVAKLAEEVGFDIECLSFYVKPNSKMFGIDEKGRYYPIKSISKKLYKIGQHATLNIENVSYAPTQSLLQKWLREVHNITYSVYPNQDKMWTCNITTIKKYKLIGTEYGKTYEEALEKGLLEGLKLLTNPQS